MRILTIASEVPPVRSGVARSVQRVVDGAREAGHLVTVKSYADSRVLAADRFRLSSLGFGLRRSDIRQHDLVHLHGPAPSVSDALLMRRRIGVDQTPVIYTHHFTVDDDPSWLDPAYRGYDIVCRRLAQSADAIVTTTESYAARVRTATGPPVRVIPWAPDLGSGPARSRTAPNQPLRVLVVGQMRRYKGHGVALDAVGGLNEIQLTLAGSGPLSDNLSAKASGLPNTTVVLAPDDGEILDLYRRHDVIALPATNRSEAFGIVLLEGMSQGCVPVASDLPGVSDVAGPTGELFAPGNPTQLRNALLGLANDRDRLVHLSNTSMRRAREFTWDRTIADYLDVYDELLAGTSPTDMTT